MSRRGSEGSVTRVENIVTRRSAGAVGEVAKVGLLQAHGDLLERVVPLLDGIVPR
jgi:hypothetical protein